ncbi:MAG: alpha/beta hydrolase [Chitinophagaceae bacterium]
MKNKELEKMYKFLITYCLLFSFSFAQAQTLLRKQWTGMRIQTKDTILIVDSVVTHSTAFNAGVKQGDILISVNNHKFLNEQAFYAYMNTLREKESILFTVKRKNKTKLLNGTTVAKPLIKVDWADVRYDWVVSNTCTLRSISYLPKNNKKSHPAIFYIPGYNCGSIESFSNSYMTPLIKKWLDEGIAVYTVEKSGIGDAFSCEACIDVDLQSDIDLYQSAYDTFSKESWVDQKNIFIWGHSMGGIIAPLLNQKTAAKGIMVFGTVYRPWSEFLLEMHRIQKPLLDSLSFEETEKFIKTIQKIYYEYFRLKKSPKELAANPEYKKIVETELEYKEGNNYMWGRHWRFWQQLDSIDLAKAWQQCNSYVLVLHGESDYIQCSALEPILIKNAVDYLHPNKTTLKTIASLDHLMMKSKDYEEAIKNLVERAFLYGNFNHQLSLETTDWVKELIQVKQ